MKANYSIKVLAIHWSLGFWGAFSWVVSIMPMEVQYQKMNASTEELMERKS